MEALFSYSFFFNTLRFALYTLHPGEVLEPSSSVEFHINERVNRVSEWIMKELFSFSRYSQSGGGELDLPDKKGVAEVIPDGQTLTTGGEG